jgi:hypothetical protein
MEMLLQPSLPPSLCPPHLPACIENGNMQAIQCVLYSSIVRPVSFDLFLRDVYAVTAEDDKLPTGSLILFKDN